MCRLRPFIVLVFLSLFTLQMSAQAPSAIQQKILGAMASDIRTDADKGRDIYRKPDQVLDFFGLTEDMRVYPVRPCWTK